MFKILVILVPVLLLTVPCTGAKRGGGYTTMFRGSWLILEHINGTRIGILQSEIRPGARGCPRGYVTEGGMGSCLPYCENQCHEGFCVGPNQCACEDDLVLLPTGKCYETCPNSCLNGFCSGFLDRDCKCNYGYELDKGRKYCKPKCRPSCGKYEVCSMSGKCKCIDGFTRENVSNSCFRVCEEDCLNGICNRVGECECHPGFILKDGVCQANCWMDCTNGRCFSENKCVCRPGYLISVPSLKCQPHCATPCSIGAFCASPNKCQCRKEARKLGGLCIMPGGYRTTKSSKCTLENPLGCLRG